MGSIHAKNRAADMGETVSQKWKTLREDGISARAVLIFVGFVGFAYSYMLRVNMNIAVVAMVNYTAIPHTNVTTAEECGREDQNSSFIDPNADGEFVWDEQMQSLITTSFYWGYIVTQLLSGILAQKFGTKYLFAAATSIAAVVTVCLPSLARAGPAYLIIGRVITGAAQGACFPSMHNLLAKWAPPLQRSSMSAFIYAGSQVGTIIGLPLSGFLIETLGWEAMFYIEGPLAVIFLLMWMTLVYDSPDQHPRISAKEKDYIARAMGSDKQHREPIPWKSILTSGPFWALLLSNVSNNWGFYLLLTELPVYMKNILRYDTQSNSLLSALPYLVMWIFSLIFARVADWIIQKKMLSTTAVRKIANTTSHGAPAVCLIIVSYIGCDATMTMVLLTLAVGLQGALYSGYMVNYLDLSPNYASVIYGITSTVGTVPSFVAPLMVATLTNGQQTLAQWRVAFLISAGLMLFETVVYLFFGSGEQQPWNHPPSCHTQVKETVEYDNVSFDANDKVN